MTKNWHALGKILTILAILICCGFPAHAKVEFFDDFNSGASPLWSNDMGNWTASGGVYYAQNPGVDPITYTGLPYDFKDFTVEFDVNVRNGGIFLRSNYQNGVLSAVSLCLFDHSGSLPEGVYWHIMHNITAGRNLYKYNYVYIPGLAAADHHFKIVVNGSNYAAYLDNDPTPVTTLVTNDFSSGRVAIYDAYPYLGEPQKIDNFSVQGTIIQESGPLCINENHYYQGLFNLGSHLTFDYKWDVASETPPGQTWDVFYVQIEDPQWGWRTLKQFDTNKDTDWLLADIAIDPQDQGLKTLRFSVTDFGPDTDPTVCLQGLSPVPLPGSLMLMFSGLLGLILSNRAKK